jgi:Ni/Co efflux regulator RcnB
MRKLILLTALAAITVPGAAIAQHHDRMHRDRTELRQDRRDVRHDRRDVRQDRRALRSDRHHAMRHARTSYVAPIRDWRYRPVTVGYRLQPSFYGSRYYINDYGTYHLRAPGRWQRWIRYGDDLLLVNVRTGRVLQVIHYRYW